MASSCSAHSSALFQTQIWCAARDSTPDAQGSSPTFGNLVSEMNLYDRCIANGLDRAKHRACADAAPLPLQAARQIFQTHGGERQKQQTVVAETMEGYSMAPDPSTDFQGGDRVRYVEGIHSGGPRRVGTISRIFTDGTSGPLRADVKFDDGIEPGVSIALLDFA
jgi:hypothetical protein